MCISVCVCVCVCEFMRVCMSVLSVYALHVGLCVCVCAVGVYPYIHNERWDMCVPERICSVLTGIPII